MFQTRSNILISFYHILVNITILKRLKITRCNFQLNCTLGRCKIGKYIFLSQFANIFLIYQTFVTNLHLIALQVARKIAPCDRAFSLSCLLRRFESHLLCIFHQNRHLTVSSAFIRDYVLDIKLHLFHTSYHRI